MSYIEIKEPFENLVYKEGVLFWSSGKKAGTKTKEGYIRVKYKGISYLAHRIIWFMFHGGLHLEQVDHRDKDKTNNKIENLRLASNGQNKANSTKVKSSSGIRGVYPYKDTWKVLCAGQYLGCYKDKEVAREVFNKKAKELWGEFWDG